MERPVWKQGEERGFFWIRVRAHKVGVEETPARERVLKESLQDLQMVERQRSKMPPSFLAWALQGQSCLQGRQAGCGRVGGPS